MSFRLVAMVLVAAMTVLTVALAVLLVFHWLFSALGDAAAARILSGFAIACLVMLAIDVLLLVGALGLFMAGPGPRNDSPRDRDNL